MGDLTCTEFMEIEQGCGLVNIKNRSVLIKPDSGENNGNETHQK
jgi:hypothetical protein